MAAFSSCSKNPPPDGFHPRASPDASGLSPVPYLGATHRLTYDRALTSFFHRLEGSWISTPGQAGSAATRRRRRRRRSSIRPHRFRRASQRALPRRSVFEGLARRPSSDTLYSTSALHTTTRRPVTNIPTRPTNLISQCLDASCMQSLRPKESIRTPHNTISVRCMMPHIICTKSNESPLLSLPFPLSLPLSPSLSLPSLLSSSRSTIRFEPSVEVLR